MLTKRTRTQVLAFVLVAAAAVSFVGAGYAGLGRLLGTDGTVVRLRMPEGGGVSPEATSPTGVCRPAVSAASGSPRRAWRPN